MQTIKKIMLGAIATALILPTVVSPQFIYAQENYFDDEIRQMFIDEKKEEIKEDKLDQEEIIEPENNSKTTDAVEKNVNLMRNGDFELSEQAPTDPHYLGAATYHDAGLWRNKNLKPQYWMYQMWKLDANPDDFKAYYKTENGNSYVHMDLNDKKPGTLSMLKSKNVPVDKNTKYIWSADLKKINNPNGINVRVNRGGAGVIDHYQYGVDEDFKFHYGIFNTGEATSLGLIFTVENQHKGEFMLDNVVLKKYDGYPLRISSPIENVKIRVGQSNTVGIAYEPVETVNKDLIWASEDESIATVDAQGRISGIGVGETYVIATSPADTSVTTKVKVEVHNDDIPIEKITIKNLDTNLTTEEKRFLDVEVTPNYVTEEPEITWISSNDSIAYFEGTKLVARSSGTVQIIAKHKDGTIFDEKTVNVTAREMDDFALMRDRWRDALIGNDETMDLTDVDIKRFVDNLDSSSVEIYDSMYKKAERDVMAFPEVWDSDQTTFEADLTSQFTKIFTLSQAFMIEGTSLYQEPEVFNEIIEAFHFMIDVKQYNGDYVQGNWWDWQIGVPQRFTKSLIILDDYINPQQRDKFINAIEGYIPDVSKQLRHGTSSTKLPNSFVTATGANMTDIGINVMGSAIIAKSSSRMDQIPQHIPSVMGINTTNSGDGFYTDGSFVQHQELAYTGSYGIEAIRGISNIVSIIDGTEWGFDESTPNYINLYSIIPDAFFPIVHRGMVMGMTQGRSISRAPGTNRYAPGTSAAAELSANLLSLADYLPLEQQNEIKEHVKYWFESSKDYYDYVAHSRDLEMLLNMKALLKDESIDAKINEELKIMSAMARVTNVRENFSVGVSMTSEKIANYESINKENLYGFHTGDGMLYVYNNDLDMFGESYWPTVDWYRLPGTTVDTRTLPKSALHRQKSAGVKWVGGVSNGKNGSAGMILDKGKQDNIGAGFDLVAKKSYFFIDDAIIALGSDISGTTNASIETIVDNRLLNEDASNSIVFNGNELEENTKQSASKQDWVHFSGKDENSNMGYYFLEDVNNLELSRQYRSGSYADINEMNGTNDVHKSNFLLMSIHHGKEVQNDKYAYVMLPGTTQKQTEKEALSNSISVIQNNSDAHAVIDVEKGVFVANVFNKNKITLDLSEYSFPIQSITVKNAPAIVIEVQKNGEVSIEVSSPNNENEKIDVSVVLKGSTVLEHEENIIDVNTTSEKLTFTFDSTNMRGMSNNLRTSYTESDEYYSLVEKFKENKIELDAKVEEEYTATSWKYMESLKFEVSEFNDRITQPDLDQEPVTVFELKEILRNIDETVLMLVKSGNKEQLIALIDSIDKTRFTEYAINELNLILEDSTTLFAERAVQEELDEYMIRLQNALDSLDKVIDLTKYEDLIDLYSNIDVNKYKADGVVKFTDSYRALDNLIASYDPTVELVVNVSDLETAFSQLISDYEALELVDTGKEVDPRLAELRKKAVQLVLEVSRLEKISDELRNETGILILMIENCDTSYDDLLAQYNKVQALYDANDSKIKEEEKNKEKDKVKDPNTGVNASYLPWLLVILASAIFVVFNRKKRVNR